MFTTESCGNQANSTAAVTFTLNPDQSFALRIHYRDHIGSSGISRVYKPSPGSAGNAAPLNLAVSGQNVVLYASQPEWTYYEPFGKLWDNANSEPDPRYTDHEYDMQTGYNYMKGRYQLPNCGRFNRPDPMRDWDWKTQPASICTSTCGIAQSKGGIHLASMFLKALAIPSWMNNSKLNLRPLWRRF